MYPVVKVRPLVEDTWLDRILNAISDTQCKIYFSNRVRESDSEKNSNVKKFQHFLCEELNQKVPGLKWKTEHIVSEEKQDSIDIYGEYKEISVAIELDTIRADQVSKKFVSRLALLPQTKVYFLSLCYPGTKTMNVKECIKYFRYCSILS